ncbi:glycosyltransferase [Aeromonas sanarellii]|nr:glycosyltransferase [Aeromonas sanarellii]
MSRSKKVAVIMSVYKNDKLVFLTDAVDSILNQSYECDFFIYRDGLVDESIQAYLDHLSNNPRVNIFSSDVNHGLAFALNNLIDKVIERKYDYIARMDSDDISRPERLSKQIEFLDKNIDIGVCGTSCKEFGASYSLAEKHLPQSHNELVDFSIVRCPFIHPTVVFRIGVFSDGVRYPTKTHFTEDMALWFHLLKNGVKFYNINEVLLEYRLDELTIARRHGFDKAKSEFSLRIKNMLEMRKVSIRNVVMISSRLAFHILPISIMKWMYKSFR